jgi:peptidoglycan hydrolase-like protein with peptidoglycan-binding domain
VFSGGGYGRYEIDEKCPGFSASFPGLEPVGLQPFTDDEARGYLRDFRGIEDDDLREAAVRQAGGLPFKLALFADVLQEQPTMTVADIRAYHEPDLLYLIERVVERIPYFGVRWVLRYGALARVLSRRFLTEFLAAYVDRGVSGDPQFDEPRLDSLPRSRGGAGHLPFSTDIRDRSELDPDLLWKRLRTYAASASWVTAEDADVLRFHPDVVNPMRRILRKQPAFAILSTDAARYFCALADGDPERWGMWIREAIHHRFQLDGGEAVPFWEETMAKAVRSGRHDWRRALAHEVLDREATGPDGERMAPEDGSPLLPPEAVSLAHFEVAASCVEEAQAKDAGPAHLLWSDARLHFDAAVSPPTASHAIPAARRALVETALLRRDAAAHPEERSTKLAEAETTVQAAVRRSRIRLFWLVFVYVLVGMVTLVLARRQRLLSARANDLIDLAWLNALLAEVLADQGRLESADKIMRSALAIGWRDRMADTIRPATAGAVFRAARSVARAEIDGGRLDLAAGLQPASGWAAEDVGPVGPAELGRLAATIDLRAGQPARALERLPGSPAPLEDRGERVRNALLRARSHLASYRPADAIGVLGPLLEVLADQSPPDSNMAETDAMQAGVREVLADAFAAVGELRNAGLELDTAVSLWDRAGARDRAAGAACAAAAIQLRESGDLNQAAYLVGAAESLQPEPGSRTWVTARLLRAELSFRLGEAGSSAELLNDTRGLLPEDAAPGLLITLAMTGLATDTGAAARWLDLLQAQLGRIRPAQARLGYLPGLLRVPALDGYAPADLLGQLRLTAALEDFEQWAPGLLDRDRQVLTLAAAELERAAGHPARAADLLGRLLAELDEAADPFLTIRACQTGSRLAGQPLPRLDEDRFGRLLDALAAFPAMQGMALLDQAGRTSNAQGAIALLERAERLLTQAGPPDVRLAGLLDALAARESQLGNAAGAAYSFQRADEIREQLGWRLDRSPTGRVAGRPRITVSFEVGSDRGIEVSATSPDDRLRRRFPAEVPVVGRILGTDAPEDLGPADEPSASLVASIARDWSGFGRAAGSLAFDPAWFATRKPLDVVLQIPDRRLASVPWELMRDPGSELVSLDPLVAALFRGPGRPGARSGEVRVVQAALNALLGSDLPVDGIMGPASRAALAAFQRSNELADTGEIDSITGSVIRGSLASRESAVRPLALVATLGFEHQRYVLRGGSPEGSDAAYEYRSAGFAVQTLEGVTPAGLRQAMAKFAGPGTRPAVLHLSAGVTVATGTLSLDFGDKAFYEESYSRSGGQQVTAKWLDSLLQADAAWGPIVILDVPRPPTETEAARMLMLRNLYASDLFELGSSSAVIATGLAAYRASLGRSRLLYPLGAGASLAEAVREVRGLARSASAGDGFPEELAFASTALFTQVPWMGVVAP